MVRGASNVCERLVQGRYPRARRPATYPLRCRATQTSHPSDGHKRYPLVETKRATVASSKPQKNHPPEPTI